MKTAVVYARYSCDNQTEQSIEGQLHVCEDFAKRNNILIIDTYIDRAMTGTNDNRPAFQKMISDSDLKNWNYVLVYKLDRFSRNKYEATIHKKKLKDNGIKVLSAMENIPDTPEGIILESLLEGMNQYYSAELSQKVLRGMRETRLKGFWQGGKLAYGYKLDGRKIAIDEEEAEIVKFVFTSYALGNYAQFIMKELKSKGILFRGRPFTYNVIYNMLRNTHYLGAYTLHGELVENLYPQIITEDLFNKVKNRLSKNHYGKKSLKVTHLLRFKLKCGYCGKPIIVESGTSRTGKTCYYYKCSGRKNLHNGCLKSIERKDVIESVILDALIAELSKPENITIIINLLLSYQNKVQKNNLILNNYLKEQRQNEFSINNIINAIEQGIISTSTNKRLQDLENRKFELEKLIAIEESKSSIVISEKTIRDFFQYGLSLSPLSLVNYFVKEIILFEEEAIIHLKTPSNNGPDKSQDFLFSLKTTKQHNIKNIVCFNIKFTI